MTESDSVMRNNRHITSFRGQQRHEVDQRNLNSANKVRLRAQNLLNTAYGGVTVLAM